MDIHYEINAPLNTEQFIQILFDSGLAERRPVDDVECMQGMLDNANLTVSAWSGDQLIGVARSVTDFYYACYLSDLAVHKDWQGKGIGKTLIEKTQMKLKPHCKLILLAAPAAHSYYSHLGFAVHERCWVK